MVGSDLGENLVLAVVLVWTGMPNGLASCRLDEPERAVKAPVVAPVDVFGDRDLDVDD